MHPFLGSAKHILVMGLLWSPVTFWVILLHRLLNQTTWTQSMIFVIPPMVIQMFITLSTWYLCKGISLDRGNLLAPLVKHLAAMPVVTGAWLLMVMGYSQGLEALMDFKGWAGLYQRSLPLMVGVGISLYFVSALVYYLIITGEKQKQAEKEALQKQIQASMAELSALKTTIHPHFLFNSLNTMGPLIQNSPGEARAFIGQLSEFLLYSLKHGNKSRVTLEDEVEHITNYLGVEAARLGERLKLELHVEPQSLQKKILPFTLFPLVENAVKHGIAQCLEGGTLSIKIKKDGPTLKIRISNPYETPSRPLKGEGHGISNLKKRIHTAYGPQARLNTEKTESSFVVTLIIPLIKEPTHE